jgi:polysaccharide biosynthesis transport protein
MNPQLPRGATPEAAGLPLADMLRIVNRYRWQVAAMAGLFAILGTVAAFSATPIYRATMVVLIESQTERVAPVEEVYDPGFTSYEYYGTQMELLRSRELIGRVVDKLGLAAVPPQPAAQSPQTPAASQRTGIATWFDWLPFVGPPTSAAPPAPVSPEQLRENAIGHVLGMMRVEMIPRTQLVRVHVESPSATEAATLANAVGDAYVESGLDSRFQATERATRWLTQRLDDLRAKLEISERALQAYREKHGIVNVGGSRGLYEQEITDNARKLREAQGTKAQLGATYWRIQQSGGDEKKLQEIGTLLLDDPVQRASDNLLQAEQAVKQLQERYGEKHPQMTAAQARLEGARRGYADALRQAANGVKARYEIATETERALQSVVESGRSQIRRLDERDYELTALERDVQTGRELYDVFLKRFKETDTQTRYDHFNARIVDPAIAPGAPFKPNRQRVVLTWTVMGVLFAFGLIALRHMLSETVRSIEQLEHDTQLSVISVLPRSSDLANRDSAPALCLEQPRAPFSEGVRSIRASLYLSDVDKRTKRILFTSALPGEGKTSVAAGFAVTLGQIERVLLLEADLRAPVLKQVFGIPGAAPGLVEVLTHQVKLEQALYRHEASGIDVLPVAASPANPSEVIASAALQKLIDDLAAKYDRIVFDSPPCHAGSDSLVLANRMDAVVFVIHAGKTSVRAIQTALKQLRSAQAPLLGHVLNQVDARNTSYGYGVEYYGYGHGYGYGNPPDRAGPAPDRD